jgi:hypothetical protein
MLAVDGQSLGRVYVLEDLLDQRFAGQRIRVEVDRAGQRMWFELTLNTIP